LAYFVINTDISAIDANGYSLTGNGDSLFIGPEAAILITRSTGSAVVASNSNQQISVAGTLAGPLTGLTASGFAAEVTVLAGAIVAAGSAGVGLTGSFARFQNMGSITADYAVTASSFVNLRNSGSLVGAYFGMSLGGGDVINDGLVDGQTAIASGGLQSLTLTNTGTISGRIWAVIGSLVDDRVVNAGTMIGDVDLDQGSDLFDGRGGRILDGSLFLGSGDDIAIGGDGAETILGGDGNDNIRGGAGDDHVVAASGDDDDSYDGGAGADTYETTSSDSRVTVDLELGYASGADTGEDGLSGFENVEGSIFGDTLNGNASENLLDGVLGNDSISGAGGDDRLIGSDGRDRLDGGNGNDVLSGGDGNDTLTGGGGSDRLNGGGEVDQLDGGPGSDRLAGGSDVDRLSGGAGADQFLFRSLADFTAATATGYDRIIDFVQGEDRIDLALIDADETTPADEAFSFVGTASGIDGNGELGFTQAGGNTFVLLQTDATPLTVIRLDGLFTLTASDFVL
jgi:Ca2+-binding RTX toxin-like protein